MEDVKSPQAGSGDLPGPISWDPEDVTLIESGTHHTEEGEVVRYAREVILEDHKRHYYVMGVYSLAPGREFRGRFNDEYHAKKNLQSMLDDPDAFWDRF